MARMARPLAQRVLCAVCNGLRQRCTASLTANLTLFRTPGAALTHSLLCAELLSPIPCCAQTPLYIISTAWVAVWKTFLDGGPVPPAISNSSLMARGVLLPNLPTTRYMLTRQSVWGYLHAQYGGGPALTEDVLANAD